jgi:hypothetical protein
MRDEYLNHLLDVHWNGPSIQQVRKDTADLQMRTIGVRW